MWLNLNLYSRRIVLSMTLFLLKFEWTRQAAHVQFSTSIAYFRHVCIRKWKQNKTRSDISIVFFAWFTYGTVAHTHIPPGSIVRCEYYTAVHGVEPLWIISKNGKYNELNGIHDGNGCVQRVCMGNRLLMDTWTSHTHAGGTMVLSFHFYVHMQFRRWIAAHTWRLIAAKTEFIVREIKTNKRRENGNKTNRNLARKAKHNSAIYRWKERRRT